MNQMTSQYIFFRKLAITVSLFVFVYSGVYFWLGAIASATLLLATNTILTPIILYLLRQNRFAVLSRYLFIAAGSIYIYATPLGIRTDLVAEFYLLPTILVTLIIFESHQKKEIMIGILFPLVTWILIHRQIFPDIPEQLQPPHFPSEIFRQANFLGAFFLIGIILKHFIDYTENLKRSAIQNSKLASLGELSAGIAHEINNPLTIISGNLGVCLTQLNDVEKIQARVISMQKACDRITRIVNGLRKFSRNALAIPHQRHPILNLITEVLTLTDVKSKKSLVSVEIDCRTQSEIFCDEIEIGQVLINLINNAVDAVKDHQEKWVRISAFDEGNQVVVQVRDSGKGIPPEVAEKLFQAFFTTKPVGEGTGLGLSIIKGILEEHQATIALKQDEPNTCFEIRFIRAD